MDFLVRCLYLFCLVRVFFKFIFWNSHSSHYIKVITFGVCAFKSFFLYSHCAFWWGTSLSLSPKPNVENVLCLIIWKLTKLSILELNSWEFIIMNAKETPFKYVMFLKYANFKLCIKSKILDFTRKWISRQCRLQIIHIQYFFIKVFCTTHFCPGSVRNQAESLYKVFALESFSGVCPCRICCSNLIAKWWKHEK